MKSLFTSIAALIVCTLAYAGPAEDLFSVQKSAKMNLASVLGIWEIGPLAANGMTYTLRLKIEQTQTTAGNKCTNAAGASAVVAVTSPSVLTPDTLAMTSNQYNTVTQNGVNCDVSVQAGPAKHFKVVNGVMTMEGTPITAAKISD